MFSILSSFLLLFFLALFGAVGYGVFRLVKSNNAPIAQIEHQFTVSELEAFVASEVEKAQAPLLVENDRLRKEVATLKQEKGTADV